MSLISRHEKPDIKRNNLIADCSRCFGLCCVALYFSAQDGFPVDKNAGVPCENLGPDFRCCAHPKLQQLGYKGCMAYDCFGAGQQVSQTSFGGHNWRAHPSSAQQMFEVFQKVRQLHEQLWYLTEALALPQASSLHQEITSILQTTENYSFLSGDELMKIDGDKNWNDVNALLLRVSVCVRGQRSDAVKLPFKCKKAGGQRVDLFAKDLRGVDLRRANLRGACLIAADLRDLDLSKVDFIGADFRDTDIRGANLSSSIFLTQAQVNVAKGDANTGLPPVLMRPLHWR